MDADTGEAVPMGLATEHTDMSRRTRLARYGTVSTALVLLNDRQLGRLVDGAVPIGSGVGGAAARLDVDGVTVFVKQIALTDLERRPEHVMSTTNLFQLPTCCQYGVGSPGFGAWRELAANVMTTNWVLENRCASFPLMYHWRVLPGPPPTPQEHADLERAVLFWNGSLGVRQRLEALAKASASIVLFMEHIPQHLGQWLTERAAGGEVESACAMVERNLRGAVSFMNANGLWHFDAHFRNVLTDGQRVYVTDLGLAVSPRFDLSPTEADFLGANVSHDGCYVVMQLVNWLVAHLTDALDWPRRFALVRRCAQGEDVFSQLPAPAKAVITRYAPVVTVMNDFYWTLHGESRTVPYPAGEIERACAAAGFAPVRAGHARHR